MRIVRRLHQRTDEKQSSHKLIERSGFVQKARLAGDYEFRNSRDIGRQHNLASRHGLHQHQRNPFAPARKYNHVGPVIPRTQVPVRYMP